jgi:hypothetical protein
MANESARQQQQLLEDNLESAKDVLLKISNVVAVGIGVKESGDVFTDEISYRVFVPAKKQLSELAPEEIIPAFINGIRTDVITPYVITNDSDVCGNERLVLSEHRPLQAGIPISTDAISVGTLGWFGKLGDGTTVLLTNKHVLYGDPSAIDKRKLKTAQPQLGDPCDCCCCVCGSDNVIGESIIGIKDTEPGNDTAVDCAIAKISPALAATIVLKITNDATTEVLKVTGTAAAVVGDKVRKIGARSGFTKGTVVHLGDIAVANPTDADSKKILIQRGQVLIIPDATETYQVKEGVCKFAFSNSGDSGAVILNEANKIIALNWGGDRTTNKVGITVASHIKNVLDKLSANGFAITLSVSPPGGDSAVVNVRTLQKEGPPGILESIRDANKQSLLYFLFEKHRREIIDLINHNRAVTLVWRRNQGPAFVAALARAAREEHYAVPFAINDITRETLLEKLAGILAAQGDEALQQDLGKFSNDLIRALKEGKTIPEFAVAMKAAGFLDTLPFSTLSKPF